MPIIYIETSSLAKRYVDEKGTQTLDDLFEGRRPTEFFVISTLAALELKSVLRRLVRGGRISEAQYQDLIADFAKDVPAISLVLPVDNRLVEEAGAALEKHPLRAGDALHFAAILRANQIAEETGQSLVVVTSDSDILDACGQEGIKTLDPAEDNASEELRRLREG